MDGSIRVEGDGRTALERGQVIAVTSAAASLGGRACDAGRLAGSSEPSRQRARALPWLGRVVAQPERCDAAALGRSAEPHGRCLSLRAGVECSPGPAREIEAISMR